MAQKAQVAAKAAPAQPKVEKMESVTIEPRVRSVKSLDPKKDHTFTFLHYDEWSIDGNETPYVLLQTESGPKGLALSTLYFATLASTGGTVGEVLKETNNKLTPDAGLSGTLRVTVSGEGDNKTFEYTIEDVEAHELIAS